MEIMEIIINDIIKETMKNYPDLKYVHADALEFAIRKAIECSKSS